MIRLIILLVCLVMASASVPQAQVAKQAWLSPIDTVTVNGEQRFRSRVFGQVGAKCTDIRPNKTVSVGFMLCTSDALPANMTGVVSITNSLTGTVSPAVKNAIRLAIGASDVNELTATTFDQLVFQLLIDLPKAKAGLWKPLRPDKDKKYHVHLGQDFQASADYYDHHHYADGGWRADLQNWLVARAAQIESVVIGTLKALAATFSEDFNCSNSANLDCALDWTEYAGTACEILSNQAKCSGTGGQTAVRAEVDTDTDDQIVSMTLVSLTKGSGGDASFDAFARKDSTTTATYYACSAADDATGNHYLYVRSGGARTDLDSSATNPTNGNTLEITSNGSSQSCTGTVALGPITDTSITGNTRAGFRYNGSDATSEAIADNFSIGDVGGGVNFFQRRRNS